MKAISKTDFSAFVNALIQDGSMDVEGVKAKESKFVFGPLDTANELRLDYDTTILPPKKYFLPQYETMMTFDLKDPSSVKIINGGKKKVIIGVHPHDMIAIKQMDKYFLNTNVDDLYLQKRKNTLVICSTPLKATDKAFYGSLMKTMGGKMPDLGFDLMVGDIGETVVIIPGTEAGNALLAKAPGLREATPDEMEKLDTLQKQAIERTSRPLAVGPKGWHSLLSSNYDSAVWAQQAEKCISCGSCTLVCPTCFCYDVNDQMNLDMVTGERKRTWDGCLLRGFSEVAGGEVFRDKKEDRYRHRFNRKGKYLPDRFGFVACIGCGRCASGCPPDIADPVDLINKLSEGSTQTVADKEVAPLDTNAAAVTADAHLYAPQSATLKRIVKLTEKETLFEIELDSGKPLGHQPGQFVEVSIFGIGEAPISVSSAPGPNTFQLVVRKAGDVTGALHAKNVGDKIGIRGPFGTGFDTEGLKGKNLLFIGGGLGVVPMRSFINYVLDHRQDYGQVTILYGCKDPREVLFKNEVEAWDKRDDVQHMRTVDTCTEGDSWDGNVGVITTIMPLVTFDPLNTVAVVVGPPIMYRFVNKSLLTMGMPEENIVVSLERRMKCGVGKCGHCQINGAYVCKEGPVFNYKDVKAHPEAF